MFAYLVAKLTHWAAIPSRETPARESPLFAETLDPLCGNRCLGATSVLIVSMFFCLPSAEKVCVAPRRAWARVLLFTFSASIRIATLKSRNQCSAIAIFRFPTWFFSFLHGINVVDARRQVPFFNACDGQSFLIRSPLILRQVSVEQQCIRARPYPQNQSDIGNKASRAFFLLLQAPPLTFQPLFFHHQTF